MKSTLDGQTIELPCPHCGHKQRQTIGKLKTLDHLTCSRCHIASDVDKAQIRREIAKVERLIKAKINKAAAELARTLGPFKK
jgi:transcription elongation factor Elf1